jgi:hypothetical protein
MNDENNNYYPIYTKKKIDMLNNYMNNDIKGDQFDYIRKQMAIKEKGMEQSMERTKELSNNISVQNNRFYEYRKRDQFSTIFDDKKLLDRNTYQKVEINPCILPTTSSNYGAYYKINKNYYY